MIIKSRSEILEDPFNRDEIFSQVNPEWNITTEEVYQQHEKLWEESPNPHADEYRFVFRPADDYDFSHSSRDRKLFLLQKARHDALTTFKFYCSPSAMIRAQPDFTKLTEDYKNDLHYPLGKYRDDIESIMTFGLNERYRNEAFRSLSTGNDIDLSVPALFLAEWEDLLFSIGDCIKSIHIVEESDRMFKEIVGKTSDLDLISDKVQTISPPRVNWTGTPQEAAYIFDLLIDNGYVENFIDVTQKTRVLQQLFLIHNRENAEVKFDTLRRYFSSDRLEDPLREIKIRKSHNYRKGKPM